MGFTSFVLQHLPPPPARVVEIGCGDVGGVVPALVAAGYDALGVDPRAPAGAHYLQIDFRELDDGTFDAAVAGRVLHHLHPLDASLDAVVSLAPVLAVDEFAWDLIDSELRVWYEAEYPKHPDAVGPASLDEWRVRHPELHAHQTVLDGLRARYEERTLEWYPYFQRWLAAEVESPDRIGYRWAGDARTSTTRSSASSR